MSSLLDPKVLAKLATTQLRARAVVEGILSGLHRSPHQGQSVEFSEHKDYAPGDDLRHIDWKAYGKFDKYYLKRFEHETNLRAFFILDASASMNYVGDDGGMSKFHYALTLVASLAYLLVRQQDAVGILVARGKDLRYLPPSAALGHLPAILSLLEGAEAAGQTDLSVAARFVAEKAGRRSAVFVLSDLFDFHDGALKQLTDLRRMKHEVAVFHLLDPDELAFPFEDSTLFLGMEGEAPLEIDPREIRDSYLEEITKLCASAKLACQRGDVEYELVKTDQPLDRLLLRFVAQRARGRS
jgi:uncharacterized protein (DUF58 family)